MLKQVHLNIPIVHMLCNIPKYVEYFKDIVAHKRRLNEFEMIALIGRVHLKDSKKAPQKLKVLGSFPITYKLVKLMS